VLKAAQRLALCIGQEVKIENSQAVKVRYNPQDSQNETWQSRNDNYDNT